MNIWNCEANCGNALFCVPPMACSLCDERIFNSLALSLSVIFS